MVIDILELGRHFMTFSTMMQASGCNVRNAEQLDVSSSSNVMELMERGSRNRHVAETNMNERSSRSHQVGMSIFFSSSIMTCLSEILSSQVLTVIVDGVSRISGTATHACLNLVDLAGSERLKSSKAEGEEAHDPLHHSCNGKACPRLACSRLANCRSPLP